MSRERRQKRTDKKVASKGHRHDRQKKIEIGSERGLYKYINHQAVDVQNEREENTIHIQGQQKQVLEQMYNIFRLLIGVPDYSSSESYGEKQKLTLVGFILISRKIRTHLDLLSIPRLWGKKLFRDNKSKY